MKREEILTKLCYYDLCNPNGVIDDMSEEELKEYNYGNYTQKDCYCGNCFYRRTKLAEESRQKMSNSKKKSNYLENHIKFLSELKKKPVICIEDNLIFKSISEACIYYEVLDSSISNNLKGKSKQLRIKKSFKYV